MVKKLNKNPVKTESLYAYACNCIACDCACNCDIVECFMDPEIYQTPYGIEHNNGQSSRDGGRWENIFYK